MTFLFLFNTAEKKLKVGPSPGRIRVKDRPLPLISPTFLIFPTNYPGYILKNIAGNQSSDPLTKFFYMCIISVYICSEQSRTMQIQRINITLPFDLAQDLRKTIPARSRSKFIAQALEDKLKRKKNLKKDLIASLKASRKSYEQVQKDWTPIEVEGWPD